MAIIGEGIQTTFLVLQGELTPPASSGVRVINGQGWTAQIRLECLGSELLPAKPGLVKVAGEWTYQIRRVSTDLATTSGGTRVFCDAVKIYGVNPGKERRSAHRSALLILYGGLKRPADSGVRVLNGPGFTGLIRPGVPGYEKLPAKFGLYKIAGEWRKSTRRMPAELARVPGEPRDFYEGLKIHGCKPFENRPQFTAEEIAEAFKDS